MDRENLTNDQAAVFALLGELRADVKHILAGLESNRRETARLRDEMQDETEKLNQRLTKVERFNTKVIAYASIALPVAITVLQWGVPALLALL
ncbi:hypothetical protein ParaKuw1_00012 [Paracoccus phage ParKuw1]|uniref:Uncharacterized protein n=1 Tax=Paracoccus phage ParKuw1 TaxID=3032415 RepID=A0AAF0FE63_9CAUD|nr:hypothetical protein ParaKuw1_00012 [Paracoccus phage ParKuw1]